jgi:hypothetical protein
VRGESSPTIHAVVLLPRVDHLEAVERTFSLDVGDKVGAVLADARASEWRNRTGQSRTRRQGHIKVLCDVLPLGPASKGSACEELSLWTRAPSLTGRTAFRALRHGQYRY